MHNNYMVIHKLIIKTVNKTIKGLLTLTRLRLSCTSTLGKAVVGALMLRITCADNFNGSSTTV